MTCSNDTYRAAIGQFFGTLQKILRRKASIAAKRVRGLRVRDLPSFIALSTLLVLLLIGGVESNPGPRQQKGSDNSLQKENSKDEPDNFSRLHDMLAKVSSTMERLETAQNTFSTTQENLSSQVSDIKTNLDTRLNEIEEKQENHEQRISELSDECDRLKEENDKLLSKVDYLENQSRRNNLLFYGVPERRNETWDDCEKTLYDIIYREMGVRSNVMIERAHRVGSAIVAKFLSYKDKVSVISRAKYLRGTSVYVREDVSEMVREKQKCLIPMMKDLRQKQERAKIQHDKLVTSVGVFTYDMKTKKITKLEKNTRQPGNYTRHERGHTEEIPSDNKETNNRHEQHDMTDSPTARDELEVLDTTQETRGKQPHPPRPSTPSLPSDLVPGPALYSEAAKTRGRRISSSSPTHRRYSGSLLSSSRARPQTKTAGKRASNVYQPSSEDNVSNSRSNKNCTDEGRSIQKEGKRQGRLDHMLKSNQFR